MSDVDLLIKKEDLSKLHKKLTDLGYLTDENYEECLSRDTTSYLNSICYRNPTMSSSFHFHWHLANSTVPTFMYKIKMDRIWQEAVSTDVGNVESLILAPHHLLIHLCEHALKPLHSFRELILACDISEVIRFYKHRLNWELLVRDSIDFNLDRLVYYSLCLTRELLGAEVPIGVIERLKPERVSYWEKKFVDIVLQNKSSSGMSYFLYLAMNKGWYDKLRFIGRTLFPPKQISAQKYPSHKSNGLHYLSRLREVFAHLPNLLCLML